MTAVGDLPSVIGDEVRQLPRSTRSHPHGEHDGSRVDEQERTVPLRELPQLKASLQTRVNYATVHGLSRLGLRAAARKGDVVAGLLADRERLEHPHADFEL